MMVSTKGRYALRVMIDMAEHPTDGYIPLRVIADRQDISEKYLEIILKLLVKDGFIAGLRGKGGGYRLLRSPDECTVGEVLRCTEENLAPVACLKNGENNCVRCGECRTLPMWRKLDRIVNDYLDSITIADLAKEDETWGDYVI